MAGHSDTSIDQAHKVEISEGIYAYIQPDGTWFINNTGFIVGDDHVVCIDACATEARTRAFVRTVRSTTHLPIRLLVNTHHHGDHTFGNSLFAGATIIAHEDCRALMEHSGTPHERDMAWWSPVDWGTVPLALPTLTFREELVLHVGGLRCEVRHAGGAAHTTNDVFVWIPERSVLFAGDLLFHRGTPFLIAGSIEGSIRTLEGVLAPLGAETVVPGHGPVTDAGLIGEVVDYLRFIQAVARQGRQAGRTPLEQARETNLGRFGSLDDPERLVGNLHRAYAELDGAPPGAPIDMNAALEDMVAFNGGHPLTCRA